MLARPLVWRMDGRGDRLMLGEPSARTLVRHLDGYIALRGLVPGDLVAIHLGVGCRAPDGDAGCEFGTSNASAPHARKQNALEYAPRIIRTEP